MVKWQSQKISIEDRLQRMAFIFALLFVVVGIFFFAASLKVRKNIDSVVEDSFSKISQNAKNSRDFSLLNARLSVFERTFYLDRSWYERESLGLQGDIDHLALVVSDPGLKALLEQLQQKFSVYLQRREWVNYLLYWRSGEDEDVDELFSLLQEIVANKIVQSAVAGSNSGYLEQLVFLISGYRESLFEIAKMNAEENPISLLSLPNDSPLPIQKKIDKLILRLRTLTASEPPLDRLGQQLVDHFLFYQYQMQQYQNEMAQLGELNWDLNKIMGSTVATMGQLDEEIKATTAASRDEIKNISIFTLGFGLIALLLFAIYLWITLKRFFKCHIQVPMGLVSKRLQLFELGDHSSPMQLNRSDEWEEVEIVFNGMVKTLQQGLAALRESEKRYREIFTNTTEGVFRATLSGQFVELNPAGAFIFGFDSADEAIKAYPDLGEYLYSDPQERDRVLARLYRYEKSLNYETIMRRKDGTSIWVSISNYLVRDDDGNILYIEGTFRDISEQRAAQESLQQLKTYLQNIIDSMPSVLVGVDINMTVTLWNKRATEESCILSKDAIGLPFTGVCQLFESEVYLPKLTETLRRRKPNRLLKVESIKKTAAGKNRYFDILIYPLSLTEVSGAVIHMDDVTERIHLEEMMVRSEKMQLIGGLAAGLAHEINNPLAVILQNAQVLGRRLSPSLDKNHQTARELGTTVETIAEYIKLRGCEKMIHSISDAGQRAAKIVENMQSFSRRGASSFIPCSLSDLIERTIDLAGSDHDMRKNFDFKKIRIVRDYDTVPHVCCEASQIQQVVLSLLKNAAQALSSGAEDPQITIRLSSPANDRVSLQIEDNGPGMTADVVARIFDPFYTTRDVGQGTGLGLSVAYFIVTQNHRGNLSVRSEEGRGSQFDLLLPVSHDTEVCALV